jgi:hypothetical protein
VIVSFWYMLSAEMVRPQRFRTNVLRGIIWLDHNVDVCLNDDRARPEYVGQGPVYGQPISQR